MDVRCENCRTIYELDDARVGDAGLTVKCQECGNLFKVRRRQETTELVSATRPEATTSLKAPERPSGAVPTVSPMPKPAPVDRVAPVAPEPIPPRRSPDVVPTEAPREVGWMLRSHRTGDVLRFRELTTLQQWIVERKVAREDEISRGGESWKPLGGIAELASFFHVVEQAAAVADASQPGLAVKHANEVGGLDSGQLGRLSTSLIPSLQPPTDDVFEAATTNSAQSQRRMSRVWQWVVLLVLMGGGGALLFILRRPPHARDTDAQQIIEHGHEALVLDTDDGYRQAIALLDHIVENTDANAQLDARVELAEAHILWATLLAEDARDLEKAGGTTVAAARTMHSEAQAHLERARRILEEPTGPEAQASTRLSLAFGDLLRAEGAPTDAIERYLERARSGELEANRDPGLPVVEGELSLRDGDPAAAQKHFAQAASTKGSYVARAHFRLAQLAAQQKHSADMQRECDAIFSVSPQHDRGHALCAQPVVTVAPTDAAIMTVSVPDAAMKPAALAPAKELSPDADYRTVLREADRLLGSGKAAQASKVYDRALELDPKGVDALIGLGNCDLAAERFLHAAERFSAALAIDPSAADAMLGLARSYKVRGRIAQATELYKKFLATNPSSDKAQIAQKALSELEKSANTPDDDTPAEKPETKTETKSEKPLPKLPEPEQEQ